MTFTPTQATPSRALGLLLAALLLGGCQTKPEPPQHILRFHMEASPNMPPPWTAPGKLPVSGIEFTYAPQPLIPEGDIVNAEMVQVDPGERLGYLFQLSDQGAKRLYMASTDNIGDKLFLFVNGQPMGFTVIEQPITNGTIVPVWMEMPDERLDEYIFDLKDSIAQTQKLKDYQENR